MAAAFSDRFSDATRQLAAAATRANRLALENAESMFGVQLKVMERNLTATGGWLGELARGEMRPGRSTRAHSCGRTTCSGWARPSRTWSVSACRPARPGPNWCRATTNQRRTRTTTDATQRSLRGSLPTQSGPADPSSAGSFLPGVLIPKCVFGAGRLLQLKGPPRRLGRRSAAAISRRRRAALAPDPTAGAAFVRKGLRPAPPRHARRAVRERSAGRLSRKRRAKAGAEALAVRSKGGR
jgi:hypothetical protein